MHIPQEILGFKTHNSNYPVTKSTTKDRAAVRMLIRRIEDGETKINDKNLSRWLTEKINAGKMQFVIALLRQESVTN